MLQSLETHKYVETSKIYSSRLVKRMSLRLVFVSVIIIEAMTLQLIKEAAKNLNLPRSQCVIAFAAQDLYKRRNKLYTTWPKQGRRVPYGTVK